MNMQAIMMQAKKMQRDIEKTQNELESKTYEGKSQLVTAVVGGNNKLISINIDVDSIEQDDKEMLEDMILVAVNNAIENMEKDKKEKLGFKCSDNLIDKNFPLFDFIGGQDEEELFHTDSHRLPT